MAEKKDIHGAHHDKAHAHPTSHTAHGKRTDDSVDKKRAEHEPDVNPEYGGETDSENRENRRKVETGEMERSGRGGPPIMAHDPGEDKSRPPPDQVPVNPPAEGRPAIEQPPLPPPDPKADAAVDTKFKIGERCRTAGVIVRVKGIRPNAHPRQGHMYDVETEDSKHAFSVFEESLESLAKPKKGDKPAKK